MTAKKLGHADFLHEFPVRSVGGEREVLGAVCEVMDGRALRAVGEVGFLGLKKLSGRFCGGGNDTRDGAEEEVHYGPVAG